MANILLEGVHDNLLEHRRVDAEPTPLLMVGVCEGLAGPSSVRFASVHKGVSESALAFAPKTRRNSAIVGARRQWMTELKFGDSGDVFVPRAIIGR